MEIRNLINQLEWHATRRWSVRQLSSISKIIIHQELAEGTIENVNRYHISPNHISQKGCPRICYHYGIRKNGEVVQMNELSSVVWHTKGQNKNAIGILFVGNFAGLGHTAATSEPTPEQLKGLDYLSDYLLKAFNFSNQELYGHYHFGKPACPGFVIQEWIENRRNNISTETPEMNKIEKTVIEIQKRLFNLGYEIGEIDGIQGIKTIAAIRNFQSDNQLTVDGVVGPQTWKNLISLTS
jgi:N-acetyl-anhydromuramyl-L-alanine amidase AmpD